MKAISQVQRNGIPLTMGAYRAVTENWEDVRLALIRETDQAFGVYDGTTF
jgi:hypothetical protein